MNQSRAFFISLAFAFVGMLLVAFYISEEEKRLLETHGKPAMVVVANKNINEMQSLDSTMFDMKSIPATYSQPGAITDPKDLEGMVALVPIREGEQIVVTKLAPKGAQTGLAPQVAANKRAMAIMVSDDNGVGKLIKPGDYVDVIAGIVYPGPDGAPQKELKTILQNIRILATGEIVTNNIPQIFETDPLTQKKVAVSGRGDQNFSNITVEVTPEQAQILIYAQDVQSGRLYLTLRNPVDRVETQVGSTTIDEVLGPDSKRAEARDREQRRIAEEARRQAELERLRQQAPADEERKPAGYDPLEAGGGVLE
ncbi:MAG: Flp pilus assembly protein CpaB [Bdellovibrionota bacterium]